MVSKVVSPSLAGCLAGGVLLALTVLHGKDGAAHSWLAPLLPCLFGVCVFVVIAFWQQPSRIVRAALVAACSLAGAVLLTHVVALRGGLTGASGPERFGLNVLMVVPLTAILLAVCLVSALMASALTVRHGRSYLNHLPLIAFLAYIGRLVAKVML